MLPGDIQNIIFEYVDSMNAFTDLPKKSAILKLIAKSDMHVLDTLGIVLQLTTHEMNLMNYRLVIEEQFYFHFRLGVLGRARLFACLNRSVYKNSACSRLVWLFIKRTPSLMKYPSYARLFHKSLLCKIVLRLNSSFRTNWD